MSHSTGQPEFVWCGVIFAPLQNLLLHECIPRNFARGMIARKFNVKVLVSLHKSRDRMPRGINMRRMLEQSREISEKQGERKERKEGRCERNKMPKF